MTVSSYKKAFQQLLNKPVKLKKFMKHSSPKTRPCGRGLKRCDRCGRAGGHISKYGLNYCRQCFREIATKLGFRKYS
mgnify:CR=1 FL=1